MASQTDERPDNDLCRAWCHGDKAAGNELIRRYYKPLCDFVYSQVNYSPDVMLDLVQRTFEIIVAKKCEIREFRAYIYRVARLKLHEHWRRRPVDRLGGDDSDDIQLPLNSSDATGAAALVRLEDGAREEHIVALALRTLSLDDQILLALRDIVNLPGNDIAEVFGVTRPIINGRINRARERLHAAVERGEQEPTARDSTLRHLDSWLVSAQGKFLAQRPEIDPQRFRRDET